MRHRKGGFKLQRNPSARRALLRGLTTSVILHERIETTVTKAKAVRPKVEHVITLAKRDTLHARRQAAAYLFEPKAVQKLFDSIGPRFADRQGGYTRILRMGKPRRGDGAETAILELLGSKLEKKGESKQQRRESRISQESEAANAQASEAATTAAASASDEAPEEPAAEAAAPAGGSAASESSEKS